MWGPRVLSMEVQLRLYSYLGAQKLFAISKSSFVSNLASAVNTVNHFQTISINFKTISINLEDKTNNSHHIGIWQIVQVTHESNSIVNCAGWGARAFVRLINYPRSITMWWIITLESDAHFNVENWPFPFIDTFTKRKNCVKSS